MTAMQLKAVSVTSKLLKNENSFEVLNQYEVIVNEIISSY